MKILLAAVLACLLAIPACAQAPGSRLPQFEDYPVNEVLRGAPSEPVLESPEERRFRTVIRQGVSKGWGVHDGTTGKELAVPGPNFAGRYVIVTWGCGSPCLMAAIVDAKTGRVFPPLFHHGPGHSYFQVPWAFPMEPLAYRLDSRLLIANICEEGESRKCGTHYFVMGDDGLKSIFQILER